jgi:hypothetical protein
MKLFGLALLTLTFISCSTVEKARTGVETIFVETVEELDFTKEDIYVDPHYDERIDRVDFTQDACQEKILDLYVSHRVLRSQRPYPDYKTFVEMERASRVCLNVASYAAFTRQYCPTDKIKLCQSLTNIRKLHKKDVDLFYFKFTPATYEKIALKYDGKNITKYPSYPACLDHLEWMMQKKIYENTLNYSKELKRLISQNETSRSDYYDAMLKIEQNNLVELSSSELKYCSEKMGLDFRVLRPCDDFKNAFICEYFINNSLDRKHL